MNNTLILKEILSNRLIKEAFIIPVYDGVIELGWKYPLILEVAEEINNNNKLIFGIDVWIISKKNDYILNSEDKITLSSMGWSISKDNNKNNLIEVKNVLSRMNVQLSEIDAVYSFVL